MPQALCGIFALAVITTVLAVSNIDYAQEQLPEQTLPRRKSLDILSQRLFNPNQNVEIMFYIAALKARSVCPSRYIRYTSIRPSSFAPGSFYVPHTKIIADGQRCGIGRQNEYLWIIPGNLLTDPISARFGNTTIAYNALQNYSRISAAFTKLNNIDPVYVAFELSSDRVCGGVVHWPKGSIFILMNAENKQYNFGTDGFIYNNENALLSFQPDPVLPPLCIYKDSLLGAFGATPIPSPSGTPPPLPSSSPNGYGGVGTLPPSPVALTTGVGSGTGGITNATVAGTMTSTTMLSTSQGNGSQLSTGTSLTPTGQTSSGNGSQLTTSTLVTTTAQPSTGNGSVPGTATGGNTNGTGGIDNGTGTGTNGTTVGTNGTMTGVNGTMNGTDVGNSSNPTTMPPTTTTTSLLSTATSGKSSNITALTSSQIVTNTAASNTTAVTTTAKLPVTVPDVSKVSSCFPAAAMVEKEDGSVVRMDELEIGDRVRVAPNKFSDIFMFTHKTTSTRAQFLAIQTLTGQSLVLTHGHYLYINGQLKAARAVKVNNVVTLWNGEQSAVVRVTPVLMDGLFNPQTMDGRIVVNGIMSSTYTEVVHPAVAHAILAPVRVLYTWGLSPFARSFHNSNYGLAQFCPIGASAY